jgi:hypothetical protein
MYVSSCTLSFIPATFKLEMICISVELVCMCHLYQLSSCHCIASNLLLSREHIRRWVLVGRLLRLGREPFTFTTAGGWAFWKEGEVTTGWIEKRSTSTDRMLLTFFHLQSAVASHNRKPRVSRHRNICESGAFSDTWIREEMALGAAGGGGCDRPGMETTIFLRMLLSLRATRRLAMLSGVVLARRTTRLTLGWMDGWWRSRSRQAWSVL